MNSRIKELAKQAGFTEEDDGDLVVWDGMETAGCTEELKKFAELIVRECISALWEEDCYVSDLAIAHFNRNKEKICQHFGVEE